MAPPENDEPLGIRQLRALERVVVSGGGARDKYAVRGAGGAEMRAREPHAPGLARALAGRGRAFRIDVFDAQDREVMSVRRPNSAGADRAEVWVCGARAAALRRELTLLKPVLSATDDSGRPLLRVKGPADTSCDCDYTVYSIQKERIGVIGKRWSGARGVDSAGGVDTAGGVEGAGEGECFDIRFPRDLEVLHKAIIIGTCFLIDFIIYDN